MRTLTILGDTGFLGSAIFTLFSTSDLRVVAVNSRRVLILENSTYSQHARSSGNPIEEISKFLGPECVVVNTIWGNLSHENFDSVIHTEYADQEISLLKKLEESNCRYISFGSIAEIDDPEISPSRNTRYSISKRRIAKELEISPLNHVWLRIASLYGPGDRRSWLVPNLINAYKAGLSVELRNPAQLINLCHVSSLANEIFNIVNSNTQGVFNVTTQQWVTIEELRNSCKDLSEPEYVARDVGPFSNTDPDALFLRSPSIKQYFREEFAKQEP